MEPGERLTDYRAYYRSRADRAAANPVYPESAAAQQAMADAVDAARSVDDLLAVAAQHAAAMGQALARDQARARAAVYAETAETVRARGPAEVLARVHEAADGPALAALLSDIERRTGLAVAVDEATRTWTASLTTLENVEVWRTAEVPERWRAELDGWAAGATDDARGAWRQVQTETAQLEPGWRLDPSTAREPRHRRLVPVADEVFEQRLAQHGTLVRGEVG